MRKVSIIGVGTSAFGKLQPGIIEIAVEACEKAIADAGIEKKSIKTFYLGNYAGEVLTGQALLAAMVARGLGLGVIPVTKVEGACASGGIALRHGIQAVATGEVDFALVAGVEKMTGVPTPKVTSALAGAVDQNLEGKVGLTFPGFFALAFRRYIHEFAVNEDLIHQVVVKSRGNALNNPICYLRKKTSLEDIKASYPVAEPLRQMDCCPISDGAAAAVICPAEIAKNFHANPVQILASTQTLGYTRLSDLSSLLSFEATVNAAKKAYQMAGITPADIDVAEIHDCFSIAEVIDSEDLGFFKKGEGAAAAAGGATSLAGTIPINPSGGLISRGHPVGATGLAQVYEIVKQLRGDAVNQVPNARTGLAHNLGGPGSTCTVTILRQQD